MITAEIRKRIIRKGRKAIFSAEDFQDIGSRASVNRALCRLASQGMIRRLTRGIYDYPKYYPTWGLSVPSFPDVAAAIVRKKSQVLQISPSRAANSLCLSNQVPAQFVYMTDGSSRTVMVLGQSIEFRKAAPSTLVGAGQMTGAVFQALRCFGKRRVTEKMIDWLANNLKENDKKLLAKQSRHVQAWMRPIIRQIAERTAH